MRFEYEGMLLWYGTPDAPAPEGTVRTGTELTVMVSVQPWNAGNNVEVLYRINQGPIERVSAKWLRNDSQKKSQYFRAHFPTFRVGDTVEYIALCRRAGRQVVPPSTQTEHFASSFHVIGAGATREPGNASELQARAMGPRGAIRPFLPLRDGGNGGGDNGNGGPPHPPPLPPINFPEIGFQFAGCLDQYHYLVPPPNEPQNTRAWFQDILRKAMAQRFGGTPQVSSVCGQGEEIGGIWLASQVDERSLNSVRILPAGEAYAFEFFEAPLRALVDRGWRFLLNSRSPEDQDKLTLTSYEFSLVPPNQLVLKIHGTAHPKSPIPDTPVTVTFTTTFSLVKGKVRVYTIPNIDVDTTLETAFIWVIIVGGALGGFAPAGELGGVLQVLVNDEVEQSKEMQENTIAGYARTIRQKLLTAFPDRFLIPGAATWSYQPHKLEFFYDKDPQVGLNGGILTTSSQSFPDLYTLRQPAVSLGGDRTVQWTLSKTPGGALPPGMVWLVSDEQGTPGFIPYRFGADFVDLRQPPDIAHITPTDQPLQVSWSVSGQLNGKLLPPATNPLDHSREILFGPIVNPDAIQDGDTATDTVAVQVTDDDGLTVSDQIQVTFVYVAKTPPPPPPPRSKLTWVASKSVFRLVGLPKSRGLRWSKSCNPSNASSENIMRR